VEEDCSSGGSRKHSPFADLGRLNQERCSETIADNSSATVLLGLPVKLLRRLPGGQRNRVKNYRISLPGRFAEENTGCESNVTLPISRCSERLLGLARLR